MVFAVPDLVVLGWFLGRRAIVELAQVEEAVAAHTQRENLFAGEEMMETKGDS